MLALDKVPNGVHFNVLNCNKYTHPQETRKATREEAILITYFSIIVQATIS